MANTRTITNLVIKKKTINTNMSKWQTQKLDIPEVGSAARSSEHPMLSGHIHSLNRVNGTIRSQNKFIKILNICLET